MDNHLKALLISHFKFLLLNYHFFICNNLLFNLTITKYFLLTSIIKAFYKIHLHLLDFKY